MPADGPLPEGELVHLCAGRARLRFSAQRGNPAFFEKLADNTTQLAGVTKVIGRPNTGSLIVHFSGPADALLPAIAERQLFVITLPAPARPLAESLWEEGTRLDGITRLASHGAVDLRSAGVMALLLYGLFQLGRGRVEITALTAFWYASNLLMSLKRDSGKPA